MAERLGLVFGIASMALFTQKSRFLLPRYTESRKDLPFVCTAQHMVVGFGMWAELSTHIDSTVLSVPQLLLVCRNAQGVRVCSFVHDVVAQRCPHKYAHIINPLGNKQLLYRPCFHDLGSLLNLNSYTSTFD